MSKKSLVEVEETIGRSDMVEELGQCAMSWKEAGQSAVSSKEVGQGRGRLKEARHILQPHIRCCEL